MNQNARESRTVPDATDGALAITGMSGRFPGAPDVPALWENLLAGREAVRRLTDEELAAAGVPPERSRHPSFVPYAAPLGDPGDFDAEFFGLTPQEARLTDPQHRVFLECAWRALEDAGVAPGSGARVGVFASSSMSTYLLANILRDPELAAGGLTYPVLIGNDKDFLATRVSYKLGLTGPSMSVQTACSGSMSALHLARRSLLDGECDLALVGGVSITFPQESGYLYQEGGIMSPDGHCRVFDADAAGTVKANGCGVVVLRRLADAEADGDRVYAQLRGTAINNDGSAKMGFTSPGVAGQAEVITRALDAAGVSAAELGYVEAHGTGTRLGDPIEIRALARAHASTGEPPAACALGSVKANLGHLDAAAGVVGLIKAALVLHHQTVPPQINFSTPNPGLELDRTPFVIHTGTHRPERPLRAAGVSSFGLGGTNGHCVLTRHVPPAGRRGGSDAPRTQRSYPVMLSAKTGTALADAARELSRHLRDHPGTPLGDVAYTLWAGRARLPRRWSVNATTSRELLDALDDFADRPDTATHNPGEDDDRAADALFTDLARAGVLRKTSLPGHPLRPTRHLVVPEAEPATAVAPAPAATTTTTTVAETGPDKEPREPGGSGGLLETVLDAWRRALGFEDIAADDDYYAIGGDSLAAVEITTILRDRTGADLGLDEFEALRTPAEVAGRIQRMTGAPDTPREVVRRIKDGSGPALFLIHPAGGTNFCYYELVRHLDEPGPVYVFSFPADRADEFATIRELAGLYLDQVRSVQPAGPYRLGGYSFGGNTALEMALMLQRAGERVEQLVMFDSHPPEAYLGPRVTMRDFLAAFPLLMEPMFGGSAADGHDLPPETLDEALARVRRPSWTDATVDELRAFFELWHRNHDALKGHYPERLFDGDLTVFEAGEQESGQILRTLAITPTAKEQWKQHITGELRIASVPGDHYTMFSRRENVRRLGAIWNATFAPAAAAPAGEDAR